MAGLIDTHAHLDFEPYGEDFAGLIEECEKNGIEKVIIPGVTIEDTLKIIELIDSYDMLYGAVGLHPSEAKSWDENSYKTLENYARHQKIVAIGETGLDYYWDTSFNDKQKEAFIGQIELAKSLNKAVIVHDRDAHSDVLAILKDLKPDKVIMHCFSGSVEFASECVKSGFFIALGGPVTFKNAKKPKEVAKAIPLENLLLETDSPYLTPHPHRGKTNYPYFVKLVAEEIAQLRGISFDELAETTTGNAKILFGIG